MGTVLAGAATAAMIAMAVLDTTVAVGLIGAGAMFRKAIKQKAAAHVADATAE